jgi:hypothetical protein
VVLVILKSLLLGKELLLILTRAILSQQLAMVLYYANGQGNEDIPNKSSDGSI